MWRRKCGFLILGSAIALCLPGQEIKVSLEEGIPVVYNLRQPLASVGVPHKFILVPDLIIASKGKGKKGAFDSVSDIRSDKSGNIYIFEAENQRIQIFSGTGIHINSIILADEDVQENEISKEFYLVGGHIIIVGRKSIIRYSPEGELVERISNPLSTLSLKPDSKGNFIGICWQTADRNTMVLAKYDSLLWLIYEIDRIEQDRSFNENETERFPPGIAFTLTADDEIIWGRNYQYVINISNPDGQKLRKIVKEWDPIAYTRDNIEKFLQKPEIPHSGFFWIEETSKLWNKQSRMARIGAWPSQASNFGCPFSAFSGLRGGSAVARNGFRRRHSFG